MRLSDMWLTLLALIAIVSVLNQQLKIWSTDPFSIGLSILVIVLCAVRARDPESGQSKMFVYIQKTIITTFVILVIIKVVEWMLS